jgi:hypothetical protein
MTNCNLRFAACNLHLEKSKVIVFKLLIAAIAILIGLRMVGAAIYTFMNGKVLVRQGLKTKWVPVPPDTDFFKLLFRDTLMGVLLVILGIALMI